jgi:hypothetical protein
MTQNLVVTVNDLTNPGTDPTNATTLDQIQVAVTIPFSAVRWVNLPLIINASTQVSAQVTWSCLRDSAYPTSTPQPPTG